MPRRTSFRFSASLLLGPILLLFGQAGATALTACPIPEIAAADARVRIPFDVVDGRIFVEADVNGAGPYRFAIDTGASGLGRADASLTAALALPPAGTGEASDGLATATVERVHLQSLALGGLAREDLDVITRDYAHGAGFSGIIGRDFFAGGLLVIDYPARMLTFSIAAPPLGDADTLAYDRPFRVPVSIGGLETEGNIDTGANVTLVLPGALYEEVETGAREAAGPGTLTNTTIDSDRGTVHGPVRIGGLTLSDVSVRVSDRYPELLIGGEALTGATIAIDQRSQRIAVCGPDAQ